MATSANKTMALKVLRRLREAGFEAYFAGGCVRDMLLQLPSADYDVATNATPQQVRRLFGRVLLVGAKFGVAMVLVAGKKVEVTTFRSDLSYSDGRRPDGVRFAGPLEDAQRRDFTINGMFYDPLHRRVIDYVGGQEDLRRRIVRTIGDPNERFAEDYLRMIRAVRFALRFDFALQPATATAIGALAGRITSISGERIFDELSKMLSRPWAANALTMLQELSLAGHILPEMFAEASIYPAAVERVAAVAGHKDLLETLAALLAGLDERRISAIIRRWGASNQVRDSICWMAGHFDHWSRAADWSLAEFKRLLCHPDYRRLARLWRVEERLRTGGAACSRRIARRRGAIPPASIQPPPFVTGKDLKDMGLSESKQLGAILKELYEDQLNERIRTRHDALELAARMIKGS